MLNYLLGLKRQQKKVLMLITDVMLVTLSLWLTFVLRADQWLIPAKNEVPLFITAALIAVPVFVKMGLYQSVIRYIGYKSILTVAKGSIVLVLIWLLVGIYVLPFYGVSKHYFPYSVALLFWLTLMFTLGGSRQIASCV